MRKALLLIAASLGFNCPIYGASYSFDILGKNPGTTGLHGENEVPGNASPATGIEIGAGISYDTSGHLLDIHIGWGSAPVAGNGVDLTGTFNGIYLSGPSSTGGTASHNYNLYPTYTGSYTAANVNETSGTFNLTGFAFTDLDGGAYTAAQQEADLLAGNWYLNITSSAFAGGEIRGQLTAVPEPQEYAAIAGVSLLTFGCWWRRRCKSKA
jgi:hypothetical protein